MGVVNYNSNFKRHKHEWDSQVKSQAIIAQYLKEKKEAEESGTETCSSSRSTLITSYFLQSLCPTKHSCIATTLLSLPFPSLCRSTLARASAGISALCCGAERYLPALSQRQQGDDDSGGGGGGGSGRSGWPASVSPTA